MVPGFHAFEVASNSEKKSRFGLLLYAALNLDGVEQKHSFSMNANHGLFCIFPFSQEFLKQTMLREIPFGKAERLKTHEDRSQEVEKRQTRAVDPKNWISCSLWSCYPNLAESPTF